VLSSSRQLEDLANLGRAGNRPRVARHPRRTGRLLSEPRKVLRPDRYRAEAEIDPQS
jgi:hypothetical protein